MCSYHIWWMFAENQENSDLIYRVSISKSQWPIFSFTFNNYFFPWKRWNWFSNHGFSLELTLGSFIALEKYTHTYPILMYFSLGAEQLLFVYTPHQWLTTLYSQDWQTKGFIIAAAHCWHQPPCQMLGPPSSLDNIPAWGVLQTGSHLKN